MRKIITFVFVLFLLVTMVACGKEQTNNVDPTIPTGIALKIKTAKVQITKSIELTYTITPATAQGDNVTISLNTSLATCTLKGNNKIVFTAGDQSGSVKLTVTTSNGISASKTIKIQIEEVPNYPDLSGYEIKIAQAEQALGEIDIRMTTETQDKYGYYTGQDRQYKIQSWEQMEDNYNCTMSVVAYPSDAPWGPSRWSYILTQAQNDAPEYDFYIVESAQIPQYVAGNAVHELTEWYNEYGRNSMNDMAVTNCSYKGKLYAICTNDIKVEDILGYNYKLFLKLQEQDPTLVEPAQMYLDGNWNYDTFKQFCIQAKNALDTIYNTAEDKYYVLSGYGCYYWQGLVNAAGIKVLDTISLEPNITGVVESQAAEVLRELYALGVMDPSFQVDGSVATWNNQHALFNTGGFWFLNNSSRWTKTLWGSEENTQYGYVPYPTNPGNTKTYTGTSADGFAVMAAGREWAYEGYGEDCTAENIYRAYMDYLVTAKEYYKGSEDYDYVTDMTAMATARFGSEASVKAYIQIMAGVKQEDGTYKDGLTELGFFDPFISDNPVVGNYGASGTFAGAVNDYIKGNGGAQWTDAVGTYYDQIKQALVEAYG